MRNSGQPISASFEPSRGLPGSVAEAIPDRRARRAFYTFLTALVLFGLHMRLANPAIQHLETDQGRDYVVVWDWLRDGRWPLVGPYRSVGDFAIGPGWYYTLAPAMALTGFHPVAGMLTISLLMAAAAVLAWRWVLLTTSSPMAALAPPVVFTLSPEWVVYDRTLWNPHTLPFTTILIATLLYSLPRRPLPCLSLLVMVLAILPHYHSTTLITIAVVVPFAVWAVVRARGRWGRYRRREWWGWGLAVGIWVALLYVPPIIYEFTPRPSNLSSYIRNTLVATPPSDLGIFERCRVPLDLFLRVTFRRNFPGQNFPPGVLERPPGQWACAILVAIAFLATLGVMARRRAEPSVLFLAVLMAAFGFVAVRKGDAFREYFFFTIIQVPVILGAWTVGCWLGRRPPLVGWGMRLVGWGIILGVLGLTARSASVAWRVHKGDVWYADSFIATEKIARWLVEDADGRPFSVVLIDPRNVRSHYDYLLRRMGHRPSNPSQSRRSLLPEELGEVLYLITQGHAPGWELATVDPIAPIGPPVEVEFARVYTLPAEAVPEDFRWLHVEWEPIEERVIPVTLRLEK